MVAPFSRAFDTDSDIPATHGTADPSVRNVSAFGPLAHVLFEQLSVTYLSPVQIRVQVFIILNDSVPCTFRLKMKQSLCGICPVKVLILYRITGSGKARHERGCCLEFFRRTSIGNLCCIRAL